MVVVWLLGQGLVFRGAPKGSQQVWQVELLSGFLASVEGLAVCLHCLAALFAAVMRTTICAEQQCSLQTALSKWWLAV